MDNCLLNQYIEQIEKFRSSDNSEFSHLSKKIYLDHAANGIYMNSLIKDYHDQLTNRNKHDQDLLSTFFSNPHSHNLSGTYTDIFIDLVRQKILALFNTNPNEYDVVFVMNATHGLKLLAETFNFNEVTEKDYKDATSDQKPFCSYFAYLIDNHTSVIGLREIVWSNHPLTQTYCLFESESSITKFKFDAKLIEPPFQFQNNSSEKYRNRSLLVYPAQSNFNGRKYEFEIIKNVQNQGLTVNTSNEEKQLKSEWFVCLDTASFVSTSKLDLAINKPDFLVVSFYKIFGFPTGIGALIIRKTERIKQALSKKAYFGGGSVSMALIDVNKVCYKNCLIKDTHTRKSTVKNYLFHTFLEDGTIPYLEIIAVGLAIEKFNKLTFDKGLILIQDHTNYLINYCIDKLIELEHFNKQKLVEIYRKQIHGSIKNNYGPILSFNLKNSAGSYIGFRLVDKLAQENHIYLRTGCFCNIGACQLYMKHLRDNTNFFENFKLHGHECGDHIDLINDLPTGAIRVSFGYCSIKQDVDKFIQFLNEHFIEYENLNNHAISAISIENIKLTSTDFKNIQKQYFKINYIYIYPIKSCAPMKIKDKWWMDSGSFIYDRNWLILDSNLIPMTQKRFNLMTKIKPLIDIESNILRLEYEDQSFEMQLEQDELIKNKIIHIKNFNCYDQGDLVSEWLSNCVFKSNENFRLARICDSICNDKTKATFANKADYLLINENSIHKLKNYLDSNLKDEDVNKLSMMYSNSLINEYLSLQFRPNIVVSTTSLDQNEKFNFEEEFWINFKILNKNIDFEIVENCTRCQMVNIDQSHDNSKSLSCYSKMLLKQLYKLKLNSKFGIYLSRKLPNNNTPVSFDKSSFFSLNQNISCKLNNELSIGDIGVAYKYNYSN